MICSIELQSVNGILQLEAIAGDWSLLLSFPQAAYEWHQQLVKDAIWVMQQLGCTDSDGLDSIAVFNLNTVEVLRFKRVIWNMLRELHSRETGLLRQTGQFDDVTNKVDTYWIKARLRNHEK